MGATARETDTQIAERMDTGQQMGTRVKSRVSAIIRGRPRLGLFAPGGLLFDSARARHAAAHSHQY